MFSPKVLDRANVIEFRVTLKEMKDYLERFTSINLENLKGQGAEMETDFVAIARDPISKDFNSEEIKIILTTFFRELQKIGAEFGYRSASEILKFAAVVNKIESSWNPIDVIDAAIMQKLLPKVHGSRRKLEPILKALCLLCLQDGQDFNEFFNAKTEIDYMDRSRIKYPIAFEKILRMYNNLISNGFTSYAEA